MDPNEEQILVSYSGPSGALVVDGVTYPQGKVLPMSRRRFLEVTANETLMADGHLLGVVPEVGPSEAPPWVPDIPFADPFELEPEVTPEPESTEVMEGSEPTVE